MAQLTGFNPVNHLLSLVSATLIIGNLTVWLAVLVLLSMIRFLLPFHWARTIITGSVDRVYRAAVKFDSWWLYRVVGIGLTIDDPMNCLERLNRNSSPVVISNHQSWFDIFVLQELITARGPIIKFLVKKELLKVPIIGWICLVLDFPALTRGTSSDGREQDLARIRSASKKLKREPGALLVFPEGSRYSDHKKSRQQAPFRFLLLPRTGGFSTILGTVTDDTWVIDLSINYNIRTNCWNCLGGQLTDVRVRVQLFTLSDIDDPGNWLNDRWHDKDRWLNADNL